MSIPYLHPFPNPSVLSRSASLPIFELPKSAIAKRKRVKDVCSSEEANAVASYLGKTAENLTVNEFQFYHAAAKCELSRSFTASDSQKRAWCFGLMAEDIFDWSGPILSAQRGASGFRKDSARTSLAGQLGEAATLLLMQHLGYVYWDHLPTLWTRAVGIKDHEEQVNWLSPITRPAQLLQEPDFIVEKREDGEFALAESKGHLVTSGAKIDYKLPIQQGLAQLKDWPKYLSPKPNASFSVSSYFQDADPGHDPSLIVYTDPPSDDEPNRRLFAELRDDDVRRGNYGSWLIGMGFDTPGNGLRERRSMESGPIELAIFKLNKHEYAVRLNRFFCPCLPSNPVPPIIDSENLIWDIGRFWSDLAWGAFPAIGIRVDALRSIEKALVSGEDIESLMSIRVPQTDDRSRIEIFDQEGQFLGSTMPDGTLFGFIGIESPFWDQRRTETFKIAELPHTGS